MQRVLILFLALHLLAGCSVDQPKARPFVFPPEWDAHEAVWISIHDAWGDPEFAALSIGSRLELVKALHQHVPVKLLTTSDSLAQAFGFRLVEMGVDTARISCIIHPQETFFLRDPGPIFLSNGEELQVANWQGVDSLTLERRPDMGLRKAIDDSLAARFGYVLRDSPLSFDGGAVDVNGRSAIAIKDYAVMHNPGLTLEQIEDEIKRTLGKEQVIWLEGVALIDANELKVDNYWGLAPGGHVDAVVRFVNDSTILVSSVAEEDRATNPIAAHDYAVFKGYLDQLSSARRMNGRPFHLVEIPSPSVQLHATPWSTAYWPAEELERLYESGLSREEDTIQVVPALSYANFLLTNGAVLVPEYWEPGMPESERLKDQRMQEILGLYYPNRAIVGLNVIGINMAGGGIHCATQQEPRIE